MRAGIGILSILIVIAIILFVCFSGPGGGYIPTVSKAGIAAQSQAQQLAGKDDNEMPAKDSIWLDEDSSGNRLRGLVVKNILPTGPMATVYGLAIGDEITGTIELSFRDQQDPELAKVLVYQAYQENKPLLIIRNGQQFTLNPNSPLTTAHPGLFAAPGAVPMGNSAPAPLPPPLPSTSLQNQQNIPTH